MGLSCLLSRCSFCRLLDRFASDSQRTPEVASHENAIYDAAKHAKGRLEPKNVPHGRHVTAVLEVVIVDERLEGPSNHLISEVTRPLESRDTGSESLTKPKVPRYPGDLLVKPDQA